MFYHTVTNRFQPFCVLLYVLIFGLAWPMNVARAQQPIVWLTSDGLAKKPAGFALYEQEWRFHPGDDPNWAKPDVKDEGWPLVKTEFTEKSPLPGWQGMGWFRLWVRVDTTLVDQLLALRFSHQGASEIFLDGQLIGGFGKVGTAKQLTQAFSPDNELTLLRLNSTRPHLLAIRYVDFNHYFPNWLGFASWIGTHDQLYHVVMDQVKLNGYALIGIAALMALALLHLFLFLFYPKQRANLFYSLFVFFTAGVILATFLYTETEIPARQLVYNVVFNVSKTLCTVMGAVLLYSIGYPSLLRWRLVLVGLGAGYLLLTYTLFRDIYIPYSFQVYFLISISDALWSLTRAIRRGQPGVWLIGLGAFLVMLLYLLVYMDIFNIIPPDNVLINLLMSIGLLALPLCFSLYLALDFARTNRNLTTQLQQVETLSAQSLAQETEKRKLITEQAERLEQTVQERTAEVQRQAEKLREMDAVKSRFFTNMTHEFRTPLTLMLGPAEQVLARSQEPETKLQVGLLQRNAQRLLRLINQLLDLSKLEAGKMELTLVRVDLVSLVRSTLQAFESLATQKQVSLCTESSLESLPMAVDQDKVEKILYNLFSNAIQFTRAGGRVGVELSQGEEAGFPWVELRVEDTGIGIVKAKLPYLFDRFYQADASDTREHEGTGIGLALTKELVELHGGRIHIDSQEGEGTIVTVRLPVHQLPSQPTDSLEKAVEATTIVVNAPFNTLPNPNPTQKNNSTPADAPVVLLIEDNEDVRTFIRASLEDDYRILEASHGQEGIHLAQQHVPDLIITDLMMPRMDGYQVCAAVKQDERTSHIPVIILTAKSDLDSRVEGLGTGADSYLSKPFSHRELIAQINNLLQVRRLLRERYSQRGIWQIGPTALPSLEQAFLDRVRAAIEAHLDDEQYSVDRLGADVGLSRTQLHRKLKAVIDQAPGDLIRVVRLEHALALLKGNVGTVAEVAYRVGFANPANFSTSFSRHFGYPPSQVPKKAHPSI
jgi:signal transduction histidine kinase/DNA-binding response OmpR family regulator